MNCLLTMFYRSKILYLLWESVFKNSLKISLVFAFSVFSVRSVEKEDSIFYGLNRQYGLTDITNFSNWNGYGKV